MFATKHPDSKEALISRQVAATVGALNGLLSEDEGNVKEGATVDDVVRQMGGKPDPYRHERDLDPHQIAAAVQQLASFSTSGPTVVGVTPNTTTDTTTLHTPRPPTTTPRTNGDDDTEVDNVATGEVQPVSGTVLMENSDNNQTVHDKSGSKGRSMRSMLKRGKDDDKKDEKTGEKEGEGSTANKAKQKTVDRVRRQSSSVKRVPSNEAQNLGDAVEARPGKGDVAAASSEENNGSAASAEISSDDSSRTLSGDRPGSDDANEYNGQSKQTDEKKAKLLSRLIADLGRLEVLWTKCEDKQAVESHLRDNRGVARTMVQALKDFPNEPVVYIKVCSLLLMSWSGYGKGVLESREQFGSDTAGIKLLGRAYHRFSAWGEHPNSEAFEMIERTLSTFRVTYSSAITLPEINRKINKFIAKPLYKRKGLFLVENPVMGSECLWGSLHKEHQKVLKDLKSGMPEHCIITLHSIIGRGLSIKDRVRGSSDPYVKIQQYEWDQPPLPDEPCLWTSFIQHKTTDPEWMLEARNAEQQHRHSWFHRSGKAATENMFEAKFNTNLKISIWDHDRLTHDDFMGRLEIDPTVVWVLNRALRKAREAQVQKAKKHHEPESERIERKMSANRRKPSHMQKHVEQRRKLSKKKSKKQHHPKLKRSFSQDLNRQKFMLRRRAVTLSAYEFRKFRDEMLKAEDAKYESESDDSDDTDTDDDDEDEIQAELKKLKLRRQRSSQQRMARRKSKGKQRRRATDNDSEAEDEKDSGPEEERKRAEAAAHGQVDIRTKSFGLKHGLPKLVESEKGVPDASDRNDPPTKKTKDDVGLLSDSKDDSVVISGKGGEADIDDSDEDEDSPHHHRLAKLKPHHHNKSTSESDDSDDKYSHHHLFSRSKTHESGLRPNHHRSFKSTVKNTFARLRYTTPTSASSGVDAFVPHQGGDQADPEPGWETTPKKEISEEEARKLEDARASSHMIMGETIDYTPPPLDESAQNKDNGKPMSKKAKREKSESSEKYPQHKRKNDSKSSQISQSYTDMSAHQDTAHHTTATSLSKSESLPATSGDWYDLKDDGSKRKQKHKHGSGDSSEYSSGEKGKDGAGNLKRQQKKAKREQKKRENERVKQDKRIRRQVARQKEKESDSSTDNVSDSSSGGGGGGGYASTRTASNLSNSSGSDWSENGSHGSSTDHTPSGSDAEMSDNSRKKKHRLSLRHRSSREPGHHGKRRHRHAYLHSDTVHIPPSQDTVVTKATQDSAMTTAAQDQDRSLGRNTVAKTTAAKDIENENRKHHLGDKLNHSNTSSNHSSSNLNSSRPSITGSNSNLGNSYNSNNNSTKSKRHIYLTHRKRVGKRGFHLNRSVQESVSDNSEDSSDDLLSFSDVTSSSDDEGSRHSNKGGGSKRRMSVAEMNRNEELLRNDKQWITLVMPLYPGEEMPAESPVREYYHKHITGTVKITLHVSDPFLRDDK